MTTSTEIGLLDHMVQQSQHQIVQSTVVSAPDIQFGTLSHVFTRV